MARRRGRKLRAGWVTAILVLAVTTSCTMVSQQGKNGEDTLNIDDLANVLDALLGDASGSSGAAVADSLEDAGLEVHFINVDQAESILIKAPDANVLIDAAENNQGDDVLDYLSEQGVEELDIAIGTHPHSDHIGGLDTVLESMAVDTVIMPIIPDEIVPTTRTYTSVLDVIEQNHLNAVASEPGNVYDLGDGAELTILGPVADYDDLNNMSVVCRLDYGATSFLFTGDACTESEEDILASGADVQADVLNVAHHGSSTSNSEEWLDAVSPSIAVISCGIDNSYGHPHREVMESLQARGLQILRTDMDGSIVVASNGEQISIATEN